MQRYLKMFAKRLPGAVVSAIILCSLSACDDSIDFESGWKDIPVVYAVLSKQDKVHYFRIEKVFQAGSTGADGSAKTPDSLYYRDITVVLTNLSTGASSELQRVDAADIGLERVEGPFVQRPNYVYTTDPTPLGWKGGEQARLTIERPGYPDITAETTVLGDVVLRENSPSNPMNLSYNRALSISWNAGTEAVIFDVTLRITVLEGNFTNGSDYNTKELEWVLVKRYTPQSNNGRVTFDELTGEDFYRFLSKSLDPSLPVKRKLSGVQLEVAASGLEILEFIAQSESNGGLTGLQQPPRYSNLSDGVGIFSCQYTAIRPNLSLNDLSRDSLINGIHTKGLHFIP